MLPNLIILAGRKVFYCGSVLLLVDTGTTQCTNAIDKQSVSNLCLPRPASSQEQKYDWEIR